MYTKYIVVYIHKCTLLFFFLQECIQYILLDTGIHAIHFIKKELNNIFFCKPKAKGCVQILFGLGKKYLAIPLKQGWLLIGGTVPHAGVSCGLLRPPQQSRILFHPGNCRANTRCSALQRWITYIVMVTYDAPEQVMFQISMKITTCCQINSLESSTTLPGRFLGTFVQTVEFNSV